MKDSELIEKELKRRFTELSKPMSAIPTGTGARLKKLNGVRFLMYDFYGTLFLSGVGDIGIDDGKSDAALMKEVLSGAGIQIKKKGAGDRSLTLYSEVVEDEIGRLKKEGIETPEPDIRQVWRSVLEQLAEKGFIEPMREEFISERVSVEFEARMNPVWPVEGVVSTLHRMKERGFYQGIISNSQFYTPIVLEALTGKSLSALGFDRRLLHWSFEEEMKKPDLKFYRRFIDKLASAFPDALPNEVLYVGNDMLKDVWPASVVGMKTALFAGDERSLKWRSDDERCKTLVPDVVITDFRQLDDIL